MLVVCLPAGECCVGVLPTLTLPLLVPRECANVRGSYVAEDAPMKDDIFPCLAGPEENVQMLEVAM
jgi:hypothetical protein